METIGAPSAQSTPMAPSFADIAGIVKAFTSACRAWKLGDDEPDVLLRVVLVVEGGEGGHVLQGVGGSGGFHRFGRRLFLL